MIYKSKNGKSADFPKSKTDKDLDGHDIEYYRPKKWSNLTSGQVKYAGWAPEAYTRMEEPTTWVTNLRKEDEKKGRPCRNTHSRSSKRKIRPRWRRRTQTQRRDLVKNHQNHRRQHARSFVSMNNACVFVRMFKKYCHNMMLLSVTWYSGAKTMHQFIAFLPILQEIQINYIAN